MAQTRHKPLTDTEIAWHLVKSQRYRHRFVPHGDPFNVVTHIERELSFQPDFSFDIVDMIKTDGVPNDARVTFSDGVHLEITEETYVGAIEGNGTDRFTLAHEIAHIILHKDKMMRRTKTLARGKAYTATSFRSNPREEWEANRFASGLLIPHSMVFPETTVRALVQRYAVSAETSARMIKDVLRLDFIIKELSSGKYG